jgi:PAS domain S-box-containing protein
MDRKVRLLLIFSIVAFAGSLMILYQQKRTQSDVRNNIYYNFFRMKKLQRINALLYEAESQSRGYLLSGDTTWRTEVIATHEQLIDSLHEYRIYASGKGASARLDSLESLTLRKLNYQDSFFNAAGKQPIMPGKVWDTHRDRQTTRGIKYLLAVEMKAVEKNLDDTIAVNESGYSTMVFLGLFGGLLAFVLVLLVIRYLNADVIRRKKAEQDLSRSESKYRNMIENAGVVIFTADMNGLITYTNNEALRLTGYSAEELIGKHFTILVDSAWIERVVIFYREQFEKRIPATNFVFLTRTRNNEEIWVEQFAHLVYEGNYISGFQCIVQDITEKKKIEAELGLSEQKRKENEFRLISILENASALIFIKDLQGRYQMVSKRFKELMGLSDEQVIGKTDADFNSPEEAAHYRQTDQKILETLLPLETEETIDTPDGQRSLLLVKFPLLDDQGRAFGISGIATDITERAQSRRQLEKALREAEEATELQDQFLSNMSHEIRTPMNGIQGMTSLLLDTDLNEEQKAFTIMIQRSVNNLTAIVNDILDVSNLKTGKLTLQRIPFNINDPLDSVRLQFSHEAISRGLAFNITMDERVPRLLTGDPYRLRQVLVSLVGNAVKFTRKGAISIHISLREKKADTVTILFRVADTGIGIAADKLEAIFENFAQASMDISRGYGGAGLGLSISRGLVRIQGGDISAESKPGEGSVFSFYLPFGLPDGVEEMKEESAEIDSRLRGRHFLVVEDNEVNQKLIGFVLKKAGGIFDIAENGKEAIALLEQGKRYDVIIMDLQMPVMDGYETAVFIRQQLRLTVPILALTATALKGDQEKCRQVGMDDFMLKPFESKDLYMRLTRLLFRGESARLSSQEQQQQTADRLYDLSLLEELDDVESILDVVSLFLNNTPAEMVDLQRSVAAADWDAVYKLAHKIKGAIGILQAQPLAALLADMERQARERTGLDRIAPEMEQLAQLFARLEDQLKEVKKNLEGGSGTKG